MAKLSNRMGTWRFDDGWHIVEKFLDSESNEEPQKIVGWVGVTQQELELLKKSFSSQGLVHRRQANQGHAA
jgi:hypothetical protein